MVDEVLEEVEKLFDRLGYGYSKRILILHNYKERRLELLEFLRKRANL